MGLLETSGAVELERSSMLAEDALATALRDQESLNSLIIAHMSTYSNNECPARVSFGVGFPPGGGPGRWRKRLATPTLVRHIASPWPASWGGRKRDTQLGTNWSLISDYYHIWTYVL